MGTPSEHQLPVLHLPHKLPANTHPQSSSDRLIRPDQIDGDEATSADRHKLIEELADPTSAGFISSSLHSSSSSVPISARTAHTDGQQTTVVSHFGRNPLSFLHKISSPWNPSSTQQQIPKSSIDGPAPQPKSSRPP
ncbi:hypothetical protein ACLOJK_036313 [Asimina triloba]